MRTFLVMALTPFILGAEAQKTDNLCHSPFHVMHVDIRHTESKGVGYKEGYTTLEGFGIYDADPYFMPFLDLRGHVFNNGKLAGNVGIGERTLIPSINHLFGLYFYYDVRQEEHDFTLNQISPGVELLGRRMEYRLNGYFPVGRDESHKYGLKFEKFEGHRILIQQKKKYAMKGFDGEVGAHITESTRDDLYAGLGPYYFTSDFRTTWGGKVRFLWRYQDYISLEASYSYDHLFKNIVQGTVSFSYPFGGKLKRSGKNCPNSNDLALSRAAFAPYRFEIPVVKQHTRKKAAINPNTGKPWQVWFVSNTSSSDGTFESPYPTLVQAQNASGPSDMIYVLPGDGTSKGMDAGIVLQNGQTLFGSGMIQKLRTTQGNIHIPAFSTLAPTLTNASGSVVTLANSNEVAGMNVQVVAGNGIDCPTAVMGAYIHDNVVTGDMAHAGISLLGHGTLRVINNRISSPDISIVPANAAISLVVLNGNYANVQIENNVCIGHSDGIFLGPSMLGPGFTTAFCDAVIEGNAISDFGNHGIFINKGMPSSTFIIKNNVVNDTQSGSLSSGGIIIILTNEGDSGRYFIHNNNIVTANSGFFASTSLGFSTHGTPFMTSTRVSIKNNTIVAIPDFTVGINIIARSSPDIICATIVNNTIQAFQVNSMGISLTGSTGTVNVDSLSNNIAPNITLTETGSGSVNTISPYSCGR